MHHSDWPAEPAKPREWSPVRWALAAWLWIVLLAAALIAEVLAGPVVAALVLALKFGGSDLALGIWLRHRGAPALCYFAWAQAFLKIAFAGFVLAIVITALEPLFGVAFNPDKFIGALILLMSGIFLTMVVTFTAATVVHHDRGRLQRLWLDKSAYGDLLANRWPLSCSGKRNRIPILLILGMLSTVCFSLVIALVCAVNALRNGNWQPWIVAVEVFAIAIIGLWQEVAALREVSIRERAVILDAGLKGRPDDRPGPAQGRTSGP